MEKEILATVDATANNVPDVPLEEKNPPEIDDVQLEEDLEATTTVIEPPALPEPDEVARDAEVPASIVCPVVVEDNTSVPQKDISPVKKCACGSTTHLRRNHRDCPLNPKAQEKKGSSKDTSKEQSQANSVGETNTMTSSKYGGTKPSVRSDPLRNRTPGGKGLNLPPPSSDEESLMSLCGTANSEETDTSKDKA